MSYRVNFFSKIKRKNKYNAKKQEFGGRKYDSKFDRCRLCGYTVVEYSQGVMTDRVSKGLYDGGKRAARPPKKKKKRKRNPSGR